MLLIGFMFTERVKNNFNEILLNSFIRKGFVLNLFSMNWQEALEWITRPYRQMSRKRVIINSSYSSKMME